MGSIMDGGEEGIFKKQFTNPATQMTQALTFYL